MACGEKPVQIICRFGPDQVFFLTVHLSFVDLIVFNIAYVRVLANSIACGFEFAVDVKLSCAQDPPPPRCRRRLAHRNK